MVGRLVLFEGRYYLVQPEHGSAYYWYFVASGLRACIELFALNDCLRRCLVFPLPTAPGGRASPSPNKVPVSWYSARLARNIRELAVRRLAAVARCAVPTHPWHTGQGRRAQACRPPGEPGPRPAAVVPGVCATINVPLLSDPLVHLPGGTRSAGCGSPSAGRRQWSARAPRSGRPPTCGTPP